MPSSEVRRCSRCGQTALVPFQEWERRFIGIAFPTKTVELQCQMCGYKVLLRPPAEIRAARLLAYLTLPAIFPSLIFFARARRKQRAWIENPVIEGASWGAPLAPAAPVLPLDERGAVLPDRRCECSAPARCVRVVLKGSWDMRLGRADAYRCDHCSRQFTISSLGHLLTLAALVSALAAVGSLLILFPSGTAVGAEVSNRWFGVGLALLGAGGWLLLIERLRVRLAHPIVPAN